MTYVYRAYGVDGQLLYVGMSDNVEQRLRQHRANKAAWIEQFSYVTAEQHLDRISAGAAEQAAIRSERPLYNVSGSGCNQSPIKLAMIAERISAESGNPLYSPQDVAAKLDRSLGFVYLLIASGELLSVKVGRFRRIPAAALDAYVTKLVQDSIPTVKAH